MVSFIYLFHQAGNDPSVHMDQDSGNGEQWKIITVIPTAYLFAIKDHYLYTSFTSTDVGHGTFRLVFWTSRVRWYRVWYGWNQQFPNRLPHQLDSRLVDRGELETASMKSFSTSMAHEVFWHTTDQNLRDSFNHWPPLWLHSSWLKLIDFGWNSMVSL